MAAHQVKLLQKKYVSVAQYALKNRLATRLVME